MYTWPSDKRIGHSQGPAKRSGNLLSLPGMYGSAVAVWKIWKSGELQ